MTTFIIQDINGALAVEPFERDVDPPDELVGGATINGVPSGTVTIRLVSVEGTTATYRMGIVTPEDGPRDT